MRKGWTAAKRTAMRRCSWHTCDDDHGRLSARTAPACRPEPYGRRRQRAGVEPLGRRLPERLSCTQIGAPWSVAAAAHCRSGGRSASSSITTLPGSPSARRSIITLPVIGRPMPETAQRRCSSMSLTVGRLPQVASTSLIEAVATRSRRAAALGQPQGLDQRLGCCRSRIGHGRRSCDETMGWLPESDPAALQPCQPARIRTGSRDGSPVRWSG